MILLTFFSWWYTSGWSQEAKLLRNRFRVIANFFSVKTLLKTLFSPWRRIISYPGATLPEHLRAFGDNLISRMIGFVVRLGVLFGAAVVFLLLAIYSLLELVIWPLLPPASIGLLVFGLLQ